MSKKFGKMRRQPMDALAAYCREYQHRIANPKDSRFRAPQEKANGYADRMIDRVGRQLTRRPSDKQTFFVEANSKGWSPGLELQANAFAWVATAFHGMLSDLTKVHRNQIRLIAHKLQYAYDVGVPSRYVGGFLYQIGGSQEVQRLRRLERGTDAPTPVVRKKPKPRNMSVAARRKMGRGAQIGKRRL